MKIRTQLCMAFLLLAVVPLTGIVLYSYLASSRAVRRLVEAEATSLAAEMGSRMDSVRAGLHRRLESLGGVPFEDLIVALEGRQAPRPWLERMARAMGEVAPLVESLEYVPVAPPPPPDPAVPPPDPEQPASLAPPVTATVRLDLETSGPQMLFIRVPQVLAQLEGTPGELVRPRLPVAESPQRGWLAGGVRVLPKDPLQPADFEERWAELVSRHPGGHRKQAVSAGVERIAGEIDDLKAIEARRELTEAERDRLEAKRKEMKMLLGREFDIKVHGDRGAVVGELRVQVSGPGVVRRVLTNTRRAEGEIPFAVDAEGRLYASNEDEQQALEAVPLETCLKETLAAGTEPTGLIVGDWVVATTREPETGLVFGIARPIHDALKEVERTAVRNLGYGLGLIGLALLGILPLSTRMTRDLKQITVGAERIARGDLAVRVPVRSGNELGVLSRAFNEMAQDLQHHQEREIERRLLEREYRRKTEELEAAREFQLSLLPRILPVHPSFEVAVSMTTATEVGGDYYDFHLGDSGTLTVAIGDATGHGVRAGTLVTAIKSLFTAFSSALGLPEFLSEANRAIRSMELDRMAMALALLRLDGGEARFAAAGMPPLLVYRWQSGEVEEVEVAGMPLGGLDSSYRERRVAVAAGDVLLLSSDGFPELLSPEGEPFGYDRVEERFTAAARGGHGTPGEILAGLESAVRDWTGGEPPADDVTFVVVRMAPE